MSDLLAEIQSFIRERARPLERDFLTRPFRELEQKFEALRADVKKRGLWAPHLPVELGGCGLSLSEFALVSEALGETPIGHYLFNAQAPDIGNCELLHAHGSAEQKSKWLEPLARGEIRSCFAMTEPEFAGSNPVWMATAARRDGERLRHRRPQMVHVERRRRGVRDRHGGDRRPMRSRTSARRRSSCR